ncbi:hypothetical protein NDU88_002779 [Pleurodeles waltl]|uniref:Uncharacterized protein n=1 Tax=Pleurodeles waltl TaxID=8319 RepID=A0AAV7KVQ4_PLEWA|nr:hypothetical protein NDU88_002779 [Pleurodeles waltl]
MAANQQTNIKTRHVNQLVYTLRMFVEGCLATVRVWQCENGKETGHAQERVVPGCGDTTRANRTHAGARHSWLPGYRKCEVSTERQTRQQDNARKALC